jgi:hypothetical protein
LHQPYDAPRQNAQEVRHARVERPEQKAPMFLQRQPARFAHEVNTNNDLSRPDSHSFSLIRIMPDQDADNGHVVGKAPDP